MCIIFIGIIRYLLQDVGTERIIMGTVMNVIANVLYTGGNYIHF